MATRHSLDGSEPLSDVGGRLRALKPEHTAVLHDIVTERVQAGLREIADELHYDYSARVTLLSDVLTCTRHFKDQTGTAGVRSAPGKGGKRYGYKAAHRREDVLPLTW